MTEIRFAPRQKVSAHTRHGNIKIEDETTGVRIIIEAADVQDFIDALTDLSKNI